MLHIKPRAICIALGFFSHELSLNCISYLKILGINYRMHLFPFSAAHL